MKTDSWNQHLFCHQSEQHFLRLQLLYHLIKELSDLEGAPSLDGFKEIQKLDLIPSSLTENSNAFCLKLEKIVFNAWSFVLVFHLGDPILIKRVLFKNGSQFFGRFKNIVTLFDLVYILQAGPFFNYPHSKGALVQRNLSRYLSLKLLSCPHSRNDLLTMVHSDLICDFESFWIKGVFSSFDPKIEINQTSDCILDISQNCNAEMLSPMKLA